MCPSSESVYPSASVFFFEGELVLFFQGAMKELVLKGAQQTILDPNHLERKRSVMNIVHIVEVRRTKKVLGRNM